MTPRRQGRTTRMLKRAVALSQEGRAVYVIAAPRDAARMADYFDRWCGDGHGIKVETDLDPTWDWERMELRGAHRNCVVLVDSTADPRVRRWIDTLKKGAA